MTAATTTPRPARWPWVVFAAAASFAAVGLVFVSLSGVSLVGDATNFIAFMGMGVVGASQSNGSLSFEVVDEGRGFDPNQVATGSGLQGMADRLAAVGGSLEIRSAPGRGTMVAGRVPVTAA